MSRVRSVRLPEDLDTAARHVAYVEGVPVNTLMVTALKTEIAKRRIDPAFGERLRERIESDQQILERFANVVERED